MNGYSLTDKMRRTRQWVKLTAVEQALFHELVAVCNDKNWQELFLCSNTRLQIALNISARTLVKAREALVKAGLIYYRSGKSAHRVSAYSFTTPFTETTADISAATTADTSAATTENITHYINSNTIKTPSIPHIKNQLLADETWKETTAMHSGLSIRFLEILPAQIDLFMQYIIATGEEHTIQTLSDAKRRFFWWWRNQGKKAYENNQETPGTIVW